MNPLLSETGVKGFSRVFEGQDRILRILARARRRARPGPGSKGLPFALLRVPCDARLAGPVEKLPPLAALALVKQFRRVRARSARVRAWPASLRFSAAPIRPAQAAPGALPARRAVFHVPHATTVSATGQPGRAQRACEALSSTGLEARACTHALRELTRRDCLTTVSAANGGSFATGPRTRAAQGSRSEAKTAEVVRWARPGCPVAAQLPRRQGFEGSKRPNSAPWSN